MSTRQFDGNNFERPLKNIGFWSVFILLLFSQCSKSGDIRAYYFPLKDLKEGLVYEYRPVNDDSLPPIYWYYRSFILQDSIYLTGTKYGETLLPEQFVREEMVSNGMLTLESFIYEQDSIGNQHQVPIDIVAGSSFPFEFKEDRGVFLHHLKWSSKVESGVSFEIVKNRSFGGDTTYLWKGQNEPAISFMVKEAIDQIAEGTLSLESEGLEIYQKNLGLVYFNKQFENGFSVEYQLADRYTMEDLEAKFTEMYGRE